MNGTRCSVLATSLAVVLLFLPFAPRTESSCDACYLGTWYKSTQCEAPTHLYCWPDRCRHDVCQESNCVNDGMCYFCVASEYCYDIAVCGCAICSQIC